MKLLVAFLAALLVMTMVLNEVHSSHFMSGRYQWDLTNNGANAVMQVTQAYAWSVC